MVGLFGGSFDPIHHGHLLAAQAALEALALERVWLIPAAEQPFKVGAHSAAADHRARMVDLAIRGEPAFGLERIELDRAGPSYTIDTLRLLRDRNPEQGFVLLLGADAAQELPQWREAGEITRLARVVRFARPGEAAASGARPDETVRVPQVEVSSTEIRDRVRAGQSIRYWVPDAVADYIAAHRLYKE